MSGVQLVLGWAAAALWFVIWEVLPGRRRHPALREALGRPVLLEIGIESLLLTLFAALWFGSLGHGGWLLLFDVARRTVHADGLTRYIAVCLLAGHGWLVVSGALATRSALLDSPLLPTAEVIHLATHGEADATNPERSGLWLSAATDSLLAGRRFMLSLWG